MADMSVKSVSTDDFKVAFRRHPAGVGIVTAEADGGPVAMTVSSLFSVGLEPPTLVFSASALSSATPTMLNVKTVVVHMLGAEQVGLAKLGATSGVDRFGEGVEWGRLPTGEPYYPAAPAWIRGRVTQTVAAGGSHLVVVEALETWSGEGDVPGPGVRPLVYHNRSWHEIGESL
jgi:flavin reductase (DIM6/NTAB) family NADH-FMN oxidoreductase RutF